ncbi:MAG: hypothetical protein HXY43_23575 [Fischerella sp.]|uniref:hypothetical protein n=1 Tax=Fischerella sp. TaxID=1191 RepID=UPI0018060CCE|nr:hypothetical protein [Fischerella sp.]NWF62153.1 hypothetical protein [Fischerella sp.]
MKISLLLTFYPIFKTDSRWLKFLDGLKCKASRFCYARSDRSFIEYDPEGERSLDISNTI